MSNSENILHNNSVDIKSTDSEYVVNDSPLLNKNEFKSETTSKIWNWLSVNKKWIIVIFLIIAIVFLFYMNQSGYFIGSFPTRSDLGSDSNSKFNLEREIESLNKRQSSNFKESLN